MKSACATPAPPRMPAMTAAACMVVGLGLAIGPAYSQDQTVYVGGPKEGQVTVDLSAIYGAELGRPAGDLVFPGSRVRPGERITLRPPRMIARRPQLQQREPARSRPAPKAVASRPTARPPARPKIAMPGPAAAPAAKQKPPPPIASIKPAAGPSAASKPAPAKQAKPPVVAAPAIKKRTPPPAPEKAAVAKPPPAPKTPAPAAAPNIDIPPPPPPPVPEVNAAPRTPVTAKNVPERKSEAPASSDEKQSGQTKQMAAIAPGGQIKSGTERRILFSPGSASLSEDGKAAIDEIAKALASDSALRVELKAYARGTGDNVSQARRLSLSRALAIRSELMRQGVRPTRIDVRALGNRVSGGVPDRADLVVFTR